MYTRIVIEIIDRFLFSQYFLLMNLMSFSFSAARAAIEKSFQIQRNT